MKKSYNIDQAAGSVTDAAGKPVWLAYNTNILTGYFGFKQTKELCLLLFYTPVMVRQIGLIFGLQTQRLDQTATAQWINVNGFRQIGVDMD